MEHEFGEGYNAKAFGFDIIQLPPNKSSREELLFVNKKKQKNFDSFGSMALKMPGSKKDKSFLRSFFSKKRRLKML